MMVSSGPSVVVAPDGTVAAAWGEEDHNSAGVPRQLFFSQHPPGGAWAAPVPVSPRTDDIGDTHLAIDGTGRAVLASPTSAAVDVTVRPPNGTFGPMQTIESTPQGGVDRLVMAMDSAGNAVLVWVKDIPDPGPHYRLEWSVVRPNGTITPPKLLDEAIPPVESTAPRIDLFSLAHDAHGNVYAVWEHGYQDLQHPENDADRIEGATIHDGTDFSAPVTLASTTDGTRFVAPQVSADPAGDVVATWQHLPLSGPATIQATLGTAPGSLQGPVVTLPQPDGKDAQAPVAAITPGADGEVLWEAGAHSETGDTIWASRWRRGAQPDSPVAIGVGLAPTLAAGDGGAMLASWAEPYADYQSTALAYSFRDPGGGFAPGQPLTQVVVGPNVPALALDSAGDAAAVWTNFVDADRSADYAWASIYDAGGPVGGPGRRDRAAPFIRSFSMTRRRFRVGSRATAKSAATGSAFRYVLESASRVRIGISRRRSGLRVGKRCRAANRVRHSRRAKKRCAYYSTVGSLLRHGRSGRNRTAFSGRIGRRPLRPGLYRATLAAVRAPGSRRVTFRVLGSG